MTRDEGAVEVVVGGPEASVAFGQPERATDGSGARIPLRIVARGIDVRTAVEIESWSGGTTSLRDYFGELAGTWRLVGIEGMERRRPEHLDQRDP